MKVRKKPVVVDAWCWDETMMMLGSVPGLESVASYHGHESRPNECTGLRIRTLEGTMAVNLGDWIIRGVKGEFYPCKPDIFAATYEPVNEPVDGPTIHEEAR